MYARRQRSPVLVRVLIVVIVLLIGVWFGGHPSWLPGPVRSAFVSQDGNDKLINQVLGLIQNDYYRKVDRSDLVNKGLGAVVASLNDKYSHYYNPSDYRSFQNEDDVFRREWRPPGLGCNRWTDWRRCRASRRFPPPCRGASPSPGGTLAPPPACHG